MHLPRVFSAGTIGYDPFALRDTLDHTFRASRQLMTAAPVMGSCNVNGLSLEDEHRVTNLVASPMRPIPSLSFILARYLFCFSRCFCLVFLQLAIFLFGEMPSALRDALGSTFHAPWGSETTVVGVSCHLSTGPRRQKIRDQPAGSAAPIRSRTVFFRRCTCRVVFAYGGI